MRCRGLMDSTIGILKRWRAVVSAAYLPQRKAESLATGSSMEQGFPWLGQPPIRWPILGWEKIRKQVTRKSNRWWIKGWIQGIHIGSWHRARRTLWAYRAILASVEHRGRLAVLLVNTFQAATLRGWLWTAWMCPQVAWATLFGRGMWQ